MAVRKTVSVQSLVVQVNRMLSDSTCTSALRQGMIAVLETILYEAGAYAGYRLLSTEEIPIDHFPEDTRRHYHLHRKL